MNAHQAVADAIWVTVEEFPGIHAGRRSGVVSPPWR